MLFQAARKARVQEQRDAKSKKRSLFRRKSKKQAAICMKMMNFVLQMMNFVLNNDDFNAKDRGRSGATEGKLQYG